MLPLAGGFARPHFAKEALLLPADAQVAHHRRETVNGWRDGCCGRSAPYPGARVVVADDGEVSLEMESAGVVRLPFNSGLGRCLVGALARVRTPYVMRLDDDLRTLPDFG